MTTACVLAFMFQCTPVQSYWTLSMWSPKERHCINGGTLSTASGSLSVVTDTFILALPIKYLLGTYVPHVKHSKLG